MMARKRKDAAPSTGDAEAGPDDDAPKAKAKRGRNLAVPVACLAVGALLGPKLLGTDGTASASASAPDPSQVSGEPVEPEPALGDVVVLDPITVNLQGGNLLKVGMALQLTEDAESSSGDDKDLDPLVDWAHALDVAISTLGARSMADLLGPDGRDAAKDELVLRLSELTDGDVVDLYFHQFVMM